MVDLVYLMCIAGSRAPRNGVVQREPVSSIHGVVRVDSESCVIGNLISKTSFDPIFFTLFKLSLITPIANRLLGNLHKMVETIKSRCLGTTYSCMSTMVMDRYFCKLRRTRHAEKACTEGSPSFRHSF